MLLAIKYIYIKLGPLRYNWIELNKITIVETNLYTGLYVRLYFLAVFAPLAVFSVHYFVSLFVFLVFHAISLSIPSCCGLTIFLGSTSNLGNLVKEKGEKEC